MMIIMKYRERIKSNLFNYVVNNKFFISYIVLSVLICVTLRLITLGFHFYIRSTLIDLLFILFFGTFGYFFKNKGRYIYYLFWLFFLTGLAIGNTIYYQFYKSFISVNLISTASMIGEVNDSLWAKIHLIQFVYLIYPVTFIIIHRFLKKKNYFINDDNGGNILKRSFVTFITIVVFLVFFGSFNDLNKLSNQFNRSYIVKKYGLCLYTINDLIQSVELENSYSFDKAVLQFKDFYCKKNSGSINEFTNKFKGKNVLFIHAESVQSFLIDLKVNGEEVTPNLNKFVKKGMHFTRFYPQISVGTSSDTEFSLLTGLLPTSKGTVFVNYYDRTYRGMPNYFNKLGYYTFSMHANSRDYWNRAVMHKNLGYKDFFGKESYEVPIDQNDSNIVGLGLGDEEFFRQSISKLIDIKNSNSPFMGTMITLSNHSPFKDVTKYLEFDVSYLEGTTMGNYLKSAHYADYAFGKFLKMLQDNNLLENTILVFYGDHEARIPQSEFDLLYNYDSENDVMVDEESDDYINTSGYNYDLLKNTPFVIYSNEEDLSGEIEYTMGMYDVLPTIANMFGFKEKYSLGHDIFGKGENIVVFPNGNVLTDKVYYSDLNEEYITFYSEPIDSNYIERISGYANNVLEVSNNIIKYDLIEKEGDQIYECK